MGPEQNPILLLVCDDYLDLVIGRDCPRVFLHKGQQFEDFADRDFNGFYDFLRDNSGRVLGVSFSPSAPPAFLLEGLRALPYIEIAYSTTVRICFGRERNFDLSISMDQYYGENRIYRSSAGRIALSFSLAPLALSEIHSIPAGKAAP